MRNYSHRPRILITGGAGFLGSHLFERLLNEGHDVICLDNQDQRARRDQHAGAGQAHQGEDLSGLQQRGLSRPGRASAAGKLLGEG